jgi:hypothetical protein
MLRFIGVSICLLAGTLGAVAWAYLASRKLRSKTWEELVAMLQPVPWDGLEQVARQDLVYSDNTQMTAQQMFDRMGGWDGLGAMHHNARVLSAILNYAERLNEEETARIKQDLEQEIWMIRVTAVLIAVDLLIPAVRPFLEPEQLVRRTAKAYYRSRNGVLSLYASCQASQMGELLAAM